MTKRLLLVVAGLALSACSEKKVSWTTYDAGPLLVDFPCTPVTAAAATKCMLSDGAEYKLDVVEKGLPLDQEFAQVTEYAKAIPKGELVDIEKWPVKWREVRQFGNFEFWMYYLDGKEYTLSVQYATLKAPPTAAEFFARAKPKAK